MAERRRSVHLDRADRAQDEACSTWESGNQSAANQQFAQRDRHMEKAFTEKDNRGRRSGQESGRRG